MLTNWEQRREFKWQILLIAVIVTGLTVFACMVSDPVFGSESSKSVDIIHDNVNPDKDISLKKLSLEELKKLDLNNFSAEDQKKIKKYLAEKEEDESADSDVDEDADIDEENTDSDVDEPSEDGEVTEEDTEEDTDSDVDVDTDADSDMDGEETSEDEVLAEETEDVVESDTDVESSDDEALNEEDADSVDDFSAEEYEASDDDVSEDEEVAEEDADSDVDTDAEDEDISEDEDVAEEDADSDVDTNTEDEELSDDEEITEEDPDSDTDTDIENEEISEDEDTDSESDPETDDEEDMTFELNAASTDKNTYSNNENNITSEGEGETVASKGTSFHPRKDNASSGSSGGSDYSGGTDQIMADGFPSTYADALAALKKEHPTWTFVAADTGVSWSTAVNAEDKGSRSLVEPEEPKAQRESSSQTYDGRWYPANRKTISHYMDPRNFLNERDIYQFLTHSYERKAQNTGTVADVIDGSFMEDRKPGGGYKSYAKCIAKAGKKAGVNPNVLAAMIIMEQGWEGSSLVSGKKDGYKGFFNFFNIGAWTTETMSSIERGLWYAKGEGNSNSSYNRPWKSPFRSIVGGAQFYRENYINNKQNTYYTKKFNVMNGAGSIGEHEYMTNVSGALSEGRLLRRAYEDHDDLHLTFIIPVYKNMPKKTCSLP